MLAAQRDDRPRERQQGNNNAYCQDNELSWFDWEAVDEELLEFARRVIALRREHPVFKRRRFSTAREMAWFRPDGERMTDDDWDSGFAKSVALALDGDEITETDPRGESIDDDSFLLVFNAHHEPLDFRLPDLGAPWRRVLDTAEPGAEPQDAQPGDAVAVGARSVTVFQAPLER